MTRIAALVLATAIAAPAFAAADSRTEFRYPDQPHIAYGSDGVARAAKDDPFAFSSGKSAISQDGARAFLGDEAAAPTPEAADVATIQAGAFSRRANADRLARDLERFGAVRVAEARTNGQALYRVQVETGSAGADRVLTAMKAAGFDGFLLP